MVSGRRRQLLTSARSPWASPLAWTGRSGWGNNGSNTVQQIVNANGVWTAQTAIDVGKKPVGLTTGLDGSIWVGNNGSNTVQQIVNANGVWTAQAAIGVGTTKTLCPHRPHHWPGRGSIWVANYSSNTVQQIAVQSNAPSDLAAVFGPGSGEMTLAWQPPVIDSGTPVISYTANCCPRHVHKNHQNE